MVLSVFMVAVPLSASGAVAMETDFTPLSSPLSLASTSTLMAVTSSVVSESSTGRGAKSSAFVAVTGSMVKLL